MNNAKDLLKQAKGELESAKRLLTAVQPRGYSGGMTGTNTGIARINNAIELIERAIDRL